jgi:hypothetical protein
MIYYDIEKEKIEDFDTIQKNILKDGFLINTWGFEDSSEQDIGYRVKRDGLIFSFTFSTFEERKQEKRRFATLSVFLEKEKTFEFLQYEKKSSLLFVYILNYDVENIDGGKLLYLKEKLDFVDERLFLRKGKFLPHMSPPYLIKYTEEAVARFIPDDVLDELDYISLGYFATYNIRKTR